MSFVPSQAHASSCGQFHKAKANDSWSRIASRYDVALKRLLQLNSAKQSTMILIGDKICINQVSPNTTNFEQPVYKRKQVVAIIREVWPDDLEEKALSIAWRESNHVPSVVGGRSNCCYGLFQIYYSVHHVWLATIGVTSAEQLLDPQVNATVAYAMFKRNGWGPWD